MKIYILLHATQEPIWVLHLSTYSMLLSFYDFECNKLDGMGGIAWYQMVLHGIRWYCLVLDGIAELDSEHQGLQIVFYSGPNPSWVVE